MTIINTVSTNETKKVDEALLLTPKTEQELLKEKAWKDYKKVLQSDASLVEQREAGLIYIKKIGEIRNIYEKKNAIINSKNINQYKN